MAKTLERRVLELIRKHDGRPINKKLSPGADLLKTMGMVQEEANDLLIDYFDTFSIEPGNFDFLKYFPNEGDWLIPNCLLPKEIRPTGQKPVPLTIRMLLKSAKAGRWIY